MKVKNWKKFQHFRDRMPPWIKLYRELLDDPDWHDLDPADAKFLVMLWLLAAEDKKKEGYLPDIKLISFRLRIDASVVYSHLSRLTGWIQGVDINPISEGHRYDAPETETETEAELPAKKKDPIKGGWRLDEDFTSDTFGKMVHTGTGEVR